LNISITYHQYPVWHKGETKDQNNNNNNIESNDKYHCNSNIKIRNNNNNLIEELPLLNKEKNKYKNENNRSFIDFKKEKKERKNKWIHAYLLVTSWIIICPVGSQQFIEDLKELKRGRICIFG